MQRRDHNNDGANGGPERATTAQRQHHYPGVVRSRPPLHGASIIIVKGEPMQISARNQFEGVVKAVKEGVVTAEVVLELPGGVEIVAVITIDSARRMGLAPGKAAIAVVKSTDVMLGVPE